jgi:hypothetical protein
MFWSVFAGSEAASVLGAVEASAFDAAGRRLF